MKIGILQAGHTPETLVDLTGDYGQLFTRLLGGHGFTIEIFSVVDMEFPAGAEVADGWLITGSRHGAYDDLPWIAPLEDLIRDIARAGLPLIGVCFGHQIIAQALGGKVEKFDGGWAIGHTEYDMGGETVAVHAWHQDQVTEKPEGATVLASNDFCENAILAYGDRIWTIQPHPEFDAEFVDGLLRTRAPGVVPDAQIAAARTTLEKPVDSARIVADMADFFRKERA